MRYFAANYVFDGKLLIKNSYISLNENNEVVYIGSENEALTERERMIFFNGIISPGFAGDSSLEGQREILGNIKELFQKDQNTSLIDCLVKFTVNQAILQPENKVQIILLQNVDLLNLKLKSDTFVKILC